MFVQYLAPLLLALAGLSCWFKRNIWIWGSLGAFSIVMAFFTDQVMWQAFPFIVGLIALWIVYMWQIGNVNLRVFLFPIIIALSVAFKLHLIPGFDNFQIAERFFLSLDSALIGLLPLALIVPIAQKRAEWLSVFTKGLAIGVGGIAVMMFLALFAGVAKWDFHLPSHFTLRIFQNLFLVCIFEEAFFRGFVQRELSQFFKKIAGGRYLALIITSLLFTATHIFWAPSIGTFAFIFIAGLLYGYTYQKTGHIESAIATHFLLNLTHMLLFTY